MIRRLVGLVVVLAAVFAVFASGASAVVVPGRALDGPSSSILGVGGVALAGDASGAVVYTKLVDGGAHVFVVALDAGIWSAPVALDTGLAAPAGTPAVAAAAGGRLAVVWVTGGVLYSSVRAGATTPFTPPTPIGPAIGTPSIAMGLSGTAYTAFLAPDGDGEAVQAARLDRTSTSFIALAAPLSDAPAAIVGAPSVAVSADATGIVSWAQLESDGLSHVLARRVFGVAASTVTADLSLPSAGALLAGSADSPTVGVGDDSSYAWVAFRQAFTDGAASVSRIVVRELIGDELQGPQLVDSFGPLPSQGLASAPNLAINGGGHGLLAFQIASANGVGVAELSTARAWSAGAPTGIAPPSPSARPLAALARDGSGVLVYAPQPNVLDAMAVRGSTVGAPFALTSAALGPVASSAGYAVASDDDGDSIIALVQGTPGALTLGVASIIAPPTAPVLTSAQRYGVSRTPLITWKASRDDFAPPSYEVLVDRRVVGSTHSTSFIPPLALAEGAHTVQVIARDAYGQHVASVVHALRIDSRPPVVSVAVDGSLVAGKAVTFAVAVSAPSGTAAVTIRYGDGGSASTVRSTHVYTKAGSYVVTVTVTDGAGLASRTERTVKIRA